MACTDLPAIFAAHYQTHQGLEPQDVYKLIYQAVFGPEHSIDNLRDAAARLSLEVLHLPAASATGPLLEPLSPLLCRVNLSPFMQQGGDVRRLWRMVRETVRTYQPGTLVDLGRAWKIFLTTPWAQRYDAAALEQFWLRMATEHFPAVHHSRAYAVANTPYYRVVLRALVTSPPLPF